MTAIDPDLVYIRPRVLGGHTKSGIVYSRDRAPRVIATVIGMPANNPLALAGEVLPGDDVMFTRYADQLIGYDRTILDWDDPDYTDHALEIAAVHHSALEVVLSGQQRLSV